MYDLFEWNLIEYFFTDSLFLLSTLGIGLFVGLIGVLVLGSIDLDVEIFDSRNTGVKVTLKEGILIYLRKVPQIFGITLVGSVIACSVMVLPFMEQPAHERYLSKEVEQYYGVEVPSDRFATVLDNPGEYVSLGEIVLGDAENAELPTSKDLIGLYDDKEKKLILFVSDGTKYKELESQG